MAFEPDPKHSKSVVDRSLGICVSMGFRDAGPDEAFFSICDLDRTHSFTVQARIERPSSGNPVKYTFPDLERRGGRCRIPVMAPDGTAHPLSLGECRMILIEAVPLLEYIWQQSPKDCGLIVQVEFSGGMPGEDEI